MTSAVNGYRESYTVKRGDSFEAVAKKQSLTRAELLQLNPQFDSKRQEAPSGKAAVAAEIEKAKKHEAGRHPDVLLPGEDLRIAPSQDRAGAKSGVDATKGSASSAVTDQTLTEAAQARGDRRTDTHVVKSGETFLQIAQDHKLKPQQLAEYNPAFDPATLDAAAKPVDARAEREKQLAGSGQRDVRALAVGEALRVAPPRNDFLVNAKGLSGPVADKRVAEIDAPRLLALRSLADVTGPQGKRDGVVSPGEAETFISAQESRLGAKRGPEKGVLDPKEQELIVRQAVLRPVVPFNGAEKALLERTLNGFDPASVTPDLAKLGASTAGMSDLRFAVEKVPSIVNFRGGPADATLRFGSNSAQSVALKLFSPSVAPLKGKFPGAAEAYEKLQVTGKVHGWVAGKGEVSLSMPMATAEGKTLRSGSMTFTASIQPENVNELNLKAIDIRNLNTLNFGSFFQYTLTTDPKRLEKVMTGASPHPNPFSLADFKPGDTVTLTAGPYYSREHEVRVLSKNPPVLRPGLDVKLDRASIDKADRLVVRMLEGKTPGSKQVLVFKGTSDQTEKTNSAGLIANPKLKENGAFARALLGLETATMNNRFDFVAMDVGTKEGMALYTAILASGQVPTAQVGQAVPGALSHGALSFDELMSSTKLSLGGYFEFKAAGKKPLPTGLGGWQVMGNLSAKPSSNVDDRRVLMLRDQQGLDVSATHQAGASAEAFGTEGALVPGTISTSRVISNGGETRAYERTQEEIGTGTVRDYVGVFGIRSLERHVTSAINRDLAHVAAGKAPVVRSITLETPAGKLTGQKAVEYLEKHQNPDDKGWIFDGPDHVNSVRVFFGTQAQRNEFAGYLRRDSEAYAKQYIENPWNHISAQPGGSAFEGEAMAYLASRIFSTSVPSGNVLTVMGHADSDTFTRQIEQMSSQNLGDFIENLHHLRKAGGAQHTYPIDVVVNVKY